MASIHVLLGLIRIKALPWDMRGLSYLRDASSFFKDQMIFHISAELILIRAFVGVYDKALKCLCDLCCTCIPSLHIKNPFQA